MSEEEYGGGLTNKCVGLVPMLPRWKVSVKENDSKIYGNTRLRQMVW